MGILGGALLSVGQCRSVVLVFISPEVQDQQRAEKVQDQQPTGTESPGPRPGGSAEHQAPAAEVRRSVGRQDLPARIFLQWVITRRGRSGPVPPGAAYSPPG